MHLSYLCGPLGVHLQMSAVNNTVVSPFHAYINNRVQATLTPMRMRMFPIFKQDQQHRRACYQHPKQCKRSAGKRPQEPKILYRGHFVSRQNTRGQLTASWPLTKLPVSDSSEAAPATQVSDPLDTGPRLNDAGEISTSFPNRDGDGIGWMC
jgi:hypothetical protein